MLTHSIFTPTEPIHKTFETGFPHLAQHWSNGQPGRSLLAVHPEGLLVPAAFVAHAAARATRRRSTPLHHTGRGLLSRQDLFCRHTARDRPNRSRHSPTQQRSGGGVQADCNPPPTHTHTPNTTRIPVWLRHQPAAQKQPVVSDLSLQDVRRRQCPAVQRVVDEHLQYGEERLGVLSQHFQTVFATASKDPRCACARASNQRQQHRGGAAHFALDPPL